MSDLIPLKRSVRFDTAANLLCMLQLLVRATLSAADDFFYAHGGMPLDNQPSVAALCRCASWRGQHLISTCSCMCVSGMEFLHVLNMYVFKY